MTGSIEGLSDEEAALAGVDGMLIKPFSTSDLRSMVSNIAASTGTSRPPFNW
jgi:hypothetical protein